ncbi:hypothetical protein HZS_2003 [Henneguya salminicola]|nr:hypothetical protein HZS_2003 [Henneguya salminicola]
MVNLPAESLSHFPSKNSIRKRISLMRSSLNLQNPRGLNQINFPEHLKSKILNQRFLIKIHIRSRTDFNIFSNRKSYIFLAAHSFGSWTERTFIQYMELSAKLT